MAGRYGGRFGTNQEQEQRRIQKEPVVVWKKEWVLPASSGSTSNVKILKWVRTGEVTKFDEEGVEVGEETIAMDLDASTLLDPLQSASAGDSFNTTPVPPATTTADAAPPAPASAATAAESTNLEVLEPTPPDNIIAAPAIEATTPADLPLAASNDDTLPDSSSQPLLTQPTVADSQGGLSSQPSVAEESPLP